MVTSLRAWTTAQILMCALGASTAWAQAVAGPEKARPVQGDPGISSMVYLSAPSSGFSATMRNRPRPVACTRTMTRRTTSSC